MCTWNNLKNTVTEVKWFRNLRKRSTWVLRKMKIWKKKTCCHLVFSDQHQVWTQNTWWCWWLPHQKVWFQYLMTNNWKLNWPLENNGDWKLCVPYLVKKRKKKITDHIRFEFLKWEIILIQCFTGTCILVLAVIITMI